ncbi:Protein MAIN-LIKE 1 [Glycine max]|nr:Protein MAIN-LIKE 1 [Glycine max]
MVRTRGLGRALGHDTGRGVGRGDHDDSDDAPQRQRPTASARRQQVPVTVANDEPVVSATDADGASVEADVYADEPIAGGDVQDTGVDTPADTGAQAAEDELEGFPGGPRDRSVLTEYVDHIAGNIWMREERPELKLSFHGRKVHSLDRSVLAIEGLVAGTTLSPLIACSIDTGDRGLLSSFVERWHRETSSFHLPVGKVTITLDDITSLLNLPVIGDLHAFQPVHVDDVVQMLVELLMVTVEAATAETAQCRGPYVLLQWVRDIYERRCQAEHWTAAAHTFLLHLLGCTLFANKSATNVHVVFLETLRDLSQTRRYAWGVVMLVHMYNHLNDASISTSRQLSGYITMLQVDCYEEDREDHTYTDVQGAPGLTLNSGCLLDPIWGAPTGPGLPYDFMLFRSAALGVTAALCQGSVSATTWTGSFALCQGSEPSDPRANGHATQPRVATQDPDTDICPITKPAAPSTSARSDVAEPRHAVEACHAIAERLESHLNPGVVTPSTSTHELIEECLRIIRSVTQN